MKGDAASTISPEGFCQRGYVGDSAAQPMSPSAGRLNCDETHTDQNGAITICRVAPKGDAAMFNPEVMYLLKALAEKMQAWMRYREAVGVLSQLSDEELYDIGVSRGEIESVARMKSWNRDETN